MHVDRRIAYVAAGQHSLVTIGQLKRFGLGRGAVRHRRDAGRLHPVHVGVYSVAPGPLTEEAQLLAAVMACGSDAALSHEHAAYLWGMLPPWDEVDVQTIHVTAPPGSRTRTPSADRRPPITSAPG